MGRGLVLVAVIAAAFFVSHGCQRSYVRITDDQAIAIGQRKIDFKPQGRTVRLVLQGVPPRRYWAVSYWVEDPKGGYSKLTVVLVDANNGKIAQVTRQSP